MSRVKCMLIPSIACRMSTFSGRLATAMFFYHVGFFPLLSMLLVCKKILWISPQHTVANEGLFVGIPQLIQQIVCCSLYYQHQLQPCTGGSVDHLVFSPCEKVLVTANKWLECNRWWFHIFFPCLPSKKRGSDPISLGHFQLGGLITTWTTLEAFISWEVNASFIRYLHGFSAQNVWVTRTDKVLPQW